MKNLNLFGIVFIDNNSPKNIAEGLIVIILASVLLLLFKRLQTFFYNKSPFLFDIYKKVLLLISNPITRLSIFIFSIYAINVGFKEIEFSLIAILIFLISLWNKQKQSLISSSFSKFSDGFYKLEDIKKNWIVKTGSPSLDEGKGKPRPSLKLNIDSKEATNTFLLLKNMQADKGIIECDVFLNPGSLINIVFFCDKEKHNWHMARFDTRGAGSSDGFLIKDQGPGVNWRGNRMIGAVTNSGTFYRIRIEFNKERARMFRDGELLAEISNPKIFGQYIGLFNECGEVSVDNFSFS